MGPDDEQAAGNNGAQVASHGNNSNNSRNNSSSNHNNNTMGRSSDLKFGARNVLEISCVHDESFLCKQPKVSYLEKIKSKVKNLGVKTSRTSIEPEKTVESADVGTFTSVTTSGILSYKPTLENHPKLVRRNSLTKSQIDNSEYVQGVSRVNLSSGEKMMSSITDSDKMNMVLNEERSSNALKTAATKNDWIHEWARNARKNTSEMSRSYTVDSNVNRIKAGDAMTRSDCFEDDFRQNRDRNKTAKTSVNNKNTNVGAFEFSSSDSILKPNFVRATGLYENSSPLEQIRMSARRRYSNEKTMNEPTSPTKRPPMSPSKIPSPVHTIGRCSRSMSRNRSHHGSTSDLNLTNNTSDTDVYLQKTAAAISTLQNIHLNNSLHNSPNQTPLQSLSPRCDYNVIEECENKMSRIQQLHKRNLSLDSTEHSNRMRLAKKSLYHNNSPMRAGQNTGEAEEYRRQQQQQHTRHHSYEGGESEKRQSRNSYLNHINDFEKADELKLESIVAKQHHRVSNKQDPGELRTFPKVNPSSPIRRSSSFSVKPMTQTNGSNPSYSKVQQRNVLNNPIKKSASSTSFKKYNLYDDDEEIYVNDDDDLDLGHYSSGSEFSENDLELGGGPITNTRCNKAFLMRMEQNKQKPDSKVSSVTQKGVMACPNTPEMRRRQPVRKTPVRDSSLSRVKQDLKSNLTVVKKPVTPKAEPKSQLTQSPSASVLANQAGGGKVLPKYLDISKYKPSQAVNFLKKDESKSYLVKTEGIKRSPSSASAVGLTRTDPTRMSNRSVKSAGQNPSQKKEPISKLDYLKLIRIAFIFSYVYFLCSSSQTDQGTRAGDVEAACQLRSNEGGDGGQEEAGGGQTTSSATAK